jgi:protein disulfide-isomerase-like protein
MGFNLQRVITNKFKLLKNILWPNNLPRLALMLAVLLALYYVYTTYLKEGFELAPAKLEDEIASGKKLVLFYADWCGHCKKIKPEWDETAKEVNKEDKKMLKVNCGGGSEEEKEIMSKYNIDGYPTIIVFDNGVASPYEGKRDKESFMSALS